MPNSFPESRPAFGVTERKVLCEMNERQYGVVVNDEGQYSIWPHGGELPAGWNAEGTIGTRDECTTHIDRVWTDMRPESLREQLTDGERASGA